MLYESLGILKYIEKPLLKVILELDQEIVNYYRNLISKHLYVKRQYYNAHISVIRNQIPLNMYNWNKYNGENIKFYYSNVINNDDIYYWINAYSIRLEDIRTELGLDNINIFDGEMHFGFNKRFHITPPFKS